MLYLAISKLLSYPSGELGQIYRDPSEVLSLAYAFDEAVGRELEAFFAGLRGLDVEGHYVEMFELAPKCPLYASHYLYRGREGEIGPYLLRLLNHYRKHGLDMDTRREMPDFLPAMLEFLGTADMEVEELRGFLRENLLSWIDQLVGCLERQGSPYAHVVRALKALALRELEG